eukprot:4879592-Amphidinium_carterae.1
MEEEEVDSMWAGDLGREARHGAGRSANGFGDLERSSSRGGEMAPRADLLQGACTCKSGRVKRVLKNFVCSGGNARQMQQGP